MDFSKIARRVIAEKQIKITDIQKKTGYSLQYLYELISGKRRWNEDTISKIYDVLGIELYYKEKEE